MKHLKLFENTTQYENYKSSDDFLLPNVSYCEDGNLFYNMYIEQKPSIIKAKFNSDIDCMLAIVDLSNVKSLTVDGEKVGFGLTHYEIWEEGEHNVEIELIDPTMINGVKYDEESGNVIQNAMFYDAEMGYDVCLTSIIIPASIKTIGYRAFQNTSYLTEITCEAIVSPEIKLNCLKMFSFSFLTSKPLSSLF